jgi:hypothetical protein
MGGENASVLARTQATQEAMTTADKLSARSRLGVNHPVRW